MKLLFFTVFDYNYLQGRTVHGSAKKQGMDKDLVEFLKHLVLTAFPIAAGLSSAAAWQECINAIHRAISDAKTKCKEPDQH